MHDTYAASQAIAVRRQADTHRDVSSLGKLIQEVRDDPTRISRGYWIGLWETTDPVELQVADAQWQSAFGAKQHVNPAIAASHFEQLGAAASSVKAYVDERVAHADASAVSAKITLTLKDIHDAIDVIGDLFRKYYTLLTASAMATLVPIIQMIGPRAPHGRQVAARREAHPASSDRACNRGSARTVCDDQHRLWL